MATTTAAAADNPCGTMVDASPNLPQLAWGDLRPGAATLEVTAPSGAPQGWTLAATARFAGQHFAWTQGPYELQADATHTLDLEVPDEAYLDDRQQTWLTSLDVTLERGPTRLSVESLSLVWGDGPHEPAWVGDPTWVAEHAPHGTLDRELGELRQAEAEVEAQEHLVLYPNPTVPSAPPAQDDDKLGVSP